MNNTNNKIKHVFGMPTLVTSLDPTSYDKKKIIKTISSNYKKQKIRNLWGNKGFFKTDIHHSLDDELNNKFKIVNYSKLIICYNKLIKTYLSLLTNKSFSYNFDIVNYTAVKHNSYMAPHLHINSDFSMTHYISFDEKQHVPTIFLNPYFFSGLVKDEEKIQNFIGKNDSINSWTYPEWMHPTKENDVMFFPSALKHYARNTDSKKLRIVISVNIRVN